MDRSEVEDHFMVGLVREGPCPSNRIIYLSENELVGRGLTTSRTILSKFVSREHFRIYYDPDEKFWVIEDSGSMNGTFVNEHKLDFRGKCPLRIGDYVGLGIDFETWSTNPDTFEDDDYFVYKFTYVKDVDFNTLCEQFRTRVDLEE